MTKMFVTTCIKNRRSQGPTRYIELHAGVAKYYIIELQKNRRSQRPTRYIDQGAGVTKYDIIELHASKTGVHKAQLDT